MKSREGPSTYNTQKTSKPLIPMREKEKNKNPIKKTTNKTTELIKVALRCQQYH